MSKQDQRTGGLNIALWVTQALLAASFIWAAAMKWFQPPEKLSQLWPWTGEVSEMLVKFTGIVDLAAGLGVLLPALLRIRPSLTPIAAAGIIMQMIVAGIFHLSRGEAADIGVNIAFALLAVFVAWGRYQKAPITAR